MKQGEVWLVTMDEDKSVGHEYYKDRPALIVMSNELISSATVVTFMPFSSSLANKHEDDILVPPSERNGLDMTSILKVHHIATFDRSRFIEKFGDIESDIYEKVKQYISKHFDI